MGKQPENHVMDDITNAPNDDNMKTIVSSSFSSSRHSYTQAIESMARLSLAGFGGALAGFSVLRRGGIAHFTGRGGGMGGRSSPPGRNLWSTTGSSASISTASNLPITWGVACLTFAGIVTHNRSFHL
mmetsp:Transcript_6335/g.9202  ORF Transcript_6335/g.9202 Transcript_6335/m.9202 type:complete len:128 (-) Transcript_6335:423-806(-)